jgi:hypothetical protein
VDASPITCLLAQNSPTAELAATASPSHCARSR